VCAESGGVGATGRRPRGAGTGREAAFLLVDKKI